MRSIRFPVLLIGTMIVIMLTLSGKSYVLAESNYQQDPISLGAEIYLENCAVCHGEQGEGRVGATLSMNWPSIRPDLAAKNIIINGVPGSAMPAWGIDQGGPLSNEQIDAVVQFILSWQTGATPFVFPTSTTIPMITPVPDVQGDPNAGAVLYGQNCKVCHGSEGEGRVGAVLAKDFPSIRPDLTIKNTIENGVPGSPMPAWAQENGGPLNEIEINDIVAYLMTWEVDKETSTLPEQSPPVPEFALSWLAGIGGVIVFILLFAAALFLIVFFQKRSQS